MPLLETGDLDIDTVAIARPHDVRINRGPDDKKLLLRSASPATPPVPCQPKIGTRQGRRPVQRRNKDFLIADEVQGDDANLVGDVGTADVEDEVKLFAQLEEGFCLCLSSGINLAEVVPGALVVIGVHSFYGCANFVMAL
jgi:hypothetical protein